MVLFFLKIILKTSYDKIAFCNAFYSIIFRNKTRLHIHGKGIPMFDNILTKTLYIKLLNTVFYAKKTDFVGVKLNFPSLSKDK
tara:strand:+ start:101847 stop:102095 length:249 start_codon:yes stop_codon:yes gene_type:complete